MRGRFNLLLLVVFVLLCVSFVSSVKPTPQVFSSSSGISIVYTKAQAFKFGDDFDLYLHIFNISNGLPYTNSSVYGIKCWIHIYNDTNDEHIFKGNFSYDSVDTFDWEVEVNNTIFSKVGFYPYIVFCNSTGAGGGFVSDELLISIDGEGELSTTTSVFVFAIILLPLLFGFLLMKWVDTLGDEHNVFKLFASLLGVGLLLVSLWFATISVLKFFFWVEMSEALSTFTLIFAIIYSVMVFYFLLYLLKKVFDSVISRKDEKMEY